MPAHEIGCKNIGVLIKKINFVAKHNTDITVMENISDNVTFAIGTIVRSPRVEYEIISVISTSESATVYAVRVVGTGNEMIMKQFVVTDPGSFEAAARTLMQVSAGSRAMPMVTEMFMDGAGGIMVMEHVSGPTLRKLVEAEGPMPQRRVIALMRDVISAVGALHSAGMTHLGITPDNIMACGGEVTLLGLSVSGEHRKPAVGFAAIEQYAGASDYSPVTDVYSLAATMLFCLTGKALPAAAEVTGATLDDMLGDDIVAPLRELLKDSLSFRIAERPASAAEMLSALDKADECLPPDEPAAGDSESTVLSIPPIPPIPSVSGDEATVVADQEETVVDGMAPEAAPQPVYVPRPMSIIHKAEALDPGQTAQKLPQDTVAGYQPEPSFSEPAEPLHYETEATGMSYRGSIDHAEPARSRKKMWWILIAILLAAAVGGGVYWYMNRPYEVSMDYSDSDDDEIVIADSDSVREVNIVVEETYDETTEYPRGYYDMVFNELVPGSGVKQMEWNGITFTFDRDGRWTNDDYYDAQLGYHSWEFTGNRRTKENYTGSDKYEPGYAIHEWDSNNRIVEMRDYNRGYTLHRTFNDNGTVASQSVDFYDESKADGYASFSYTYDSHHNWVTRTGGSGKVTRRIEYYD